MLRLHANIHAYMNVFIHKNFFAHHTHDIYNTHSVIKKKNEKISANKLKLNIP